MGGVLVIGAVFFSSLLWARPDNRFVWLVLFTMVYLGVLGFLDDYLKVTKKKTDGVPGRVKLLCQLALACIVTAVFLTSPLLEVQARSLYVPFIKSPVGKLSGPDLDRLWSDLGDADAGKAYAALWTLVDARERTLPYLRERLQPIRRHKHTLACGPR